MKLGIRLQILVSLAALLVIIFVPLFIAVARLTRATIEQQDQGTVHPPRPPVPPPLLPLVALYTGLFALALLVSAYIVLTRNIVRPIDALTHAARRVAGGGRTLEPLSFGPRELRLLGESLSEMTAKLRADEERMKGQIAELELATTRLREAQNRLVRSERLASVGRLAAGLAHEIGNPVAALLGLEDILLAGGLSQDEQQDFLQRIRGETERIHRILRDLLDFARPVEGGTRAGGNQDHEPGDVRGAVEDVLSLVRPQKAFRELRIVSELEPQLLRVRLSREHLMQVLLNLLLNAVDALGGGHGGTIRIEAVQLPSSVRLTVRDDGPGISPAIIGRLFEPFTTTKEIGHGTGLGLAVCRGLIDGAGGSIALEERDGVTTGASFVVELPTSDLSPPPPEPR